MKINDMKINDMKISEMANQFGFKIAAGNGLDRKISKIYICDLLSFAMSKAPKDSVWITVINNINVIAVASLADVSCVIMAEGVTPDEQAVEKAESIGIPLLLSDLPAFEIGQSIAARIDG